MKGSIIVKDITALQIPESNPNEIEIMYKQNVYHLKDTDQQGTVYYIQKWFNSLTIVRDSEGSDALNPDRYRQLKVYNREGAKVVFKDFEVLINVYESTMCEKIISKKGKKIFLNSSTPIDVVNNH